MKASGFCYWVQIGDIEAEGHEASMKYMIDINVTVDRKPTARSVSSGIVRRSGTGKTARSPHNGISDRPWHAELAAMLNYLSDDALFTVVDCHG
jgi:hypothetical protein